MSEAWYESRFTGLFHDFQRLKPRVHDPHVSVCAGTVPHLHPGAADVLHVGGCGWSDEEAEAACVGEAIERVYAYPTNRDAAIESSYDEWPLDEPPIAPERWVLFHLEQYASNGFQFEPLTDKTRCNWVCFRDALSGQPAWVPEEFAFLLPRPGCRHRFCPATSTGLAAGRAGQPLVLRALQEVIERDALLGAWWGNYGLEEFEEDCAWTDEEASRLRRPNLKWRFLKINTPFSSHVTMVTIEGEDREGYCHSVGSACRESRRASWNKALLEAVQGRHYVRYLRRHHATTGSRPQLETFPDHAVYYSFNPNELERTPLARARRATEHGAPPDENLAMLYERLEQLSPVLVRNLTPSMLVREGLDWRVVKVIVPGLQPLHGDDRFAHLGGPLWMPRGLREWRQAPPHPFP